MGAYQPMQGTGKVLVGAGRLRRTANARHPEGAGGERFSGAGRARRVGGGLQLQASIR